MLGLFKPKCPLDTREKVWVERRMLWLVERFGASRLRGARVVLPTEEFFPDQYRGDEPGARQCFVRVCGYMGVDADSVRLQIVDDAQMAGIAGLYERRTRSMIRVKRSSLATPTALIATIAHEVAHELLIKGEHLDPETTADHEQLTDLLPVFLGMGIFVANSTVESSSVSDGQWSYFSISKQGYLSSITLGYALALFAHARGEDSPEWASHLRTDAAVTLRSSLRFLRKTNDSLFLPDTPDTPKRVPAPQDVLRHLEDKSPTIRLSALWDISEYRLASPDLMPHVERCLDDRDEGVQYGAIQALPVFGPAAAGVVPWLIEAANSGDPEFQAAAIAALGEIGACPQTVPALVRLLDHDAPHVVCHAASALGRLGPDAVAAESPLLTALAVAAEVGDDARLSALIDAVLAVMHAGRSRIRELVAKHEPGVRDYVLSHLDEKS